MYNLNEIFRQPATSSTKSSSASSKGSSSLDYGRLQCVTQISDVYMQAKGYEVTQRNGQRISTLIGAQVPEDGLCREVFVGRLPRDMLEIELMPVMEKIGIVYKMRLMMDFSGSNRGYAYVMFLDPLDASEACQQLNDTYLRPDSEHKIGVVPSRNNRTLYIGNLPPAKSAPKEMVSAELRKIAGGIEFIRFPPTKNGLRCIFVRFKTHDDATKARRVLRPNDARFLGVKVKVEWAKPDEPIMLTRAVANDISDNMKVQYLLGAEKFKLFTELLKMQFIT